MMRGTAAGVMILCLRALAQEPAPCTLRGTVTDSASHQPVVRARVMAEVRGSYSFVRLTDEQGSFCFERLTPANYHLTVQKAGYLDMQRSAILAVEENTVLKPLAMEMTRYGAISGTVVDDAGEPVPGAEVTVWDRVRDKSGWSPTEADRATADSNGRFRISELAPDTYYLSVKPVDANYGRIALPLLDSQGQMPREKEVETFYSSSFSFSGAHPVEIGEGRQVENLVLTLRKAPVRRLTGRVESPPSSGFLRCLGETETGSPANAVLPIGKDGSFTAADLLPAQYTCQLMDGHRLIASKEVDLANGDALGITLDPIETVDVPVTFRTEGKGPAFRLQNMVDVLLLADGLDGAVTPRVQDDGSYRFEGVPRGLYRVRFNNYTGQKLYLKGTVYGGEAVSDNGTVDLRSGAPKALEVTFSSKLAELQGRAVAPKGTADDESDGVTVILVDQASRGEELAVARRAETDQKGRFHMATVPPGKYRLLAIEGFDEDDWSPSLAKALGEKSVDLELKESEKKQVDVTVISADEWEAAVKKSGG
jgi:protocatechuate 3,4-dioxygenase beta subunit